jgi:hypothetical protein
MDETFKRESVVEEAFRVVDGLYVIGSLERGVTVYKQQVRAHNLAWAISELQTANQFPAVESIAVVGGGITGLTFAACMLSLFQNASITVFEQLWDLCPLQQGADNRWLHPKIYDWPAAGSRAPAASLPVLNWSEGRASDVARIVVSEFGRYSQRFDAAQDRLKVYIGLGYLRITAAERQIAWMGNRAQRVDSFFRAGEPEGDSAKFDIVAVACGFGIESRVAKYPTPSYWRNEQIGQPLLDGTREMFVISGYGDGALTDLFRLTIERFRQDTILVELFQKHLKEVENHFAARPEAELNANVFDLFVQSERDWLRDARDRLSVRLRKDTRVVLHIKGKDGGTKSFREVFGPHSSFLNRLLTFLLYKCGAFSISLDDLQKSIIRHQVPAGNVLCRYGSDTMGHLRRIFIDFEHIEQRLKDMKDRQSQTARLEWKPGTFPNVT